MLLQSPAGCCAAGAHNVTPTMRGEGRRLMTTIEIELSDATAQAAGKAGLLTTEALERLLNEALRRKEAADSFLSVADRVAVAGIAPMSMEEINAEVKAARAARKQRAGGR
jgi:hypothetical protein